LASSLRFFRIINPKIEEYLKFCTTGNRDSHSLPDEEIIQIGNYLKQEEKIETTRETPPDLNYNSLTLNVTGGCNLACKYCFAITSGARSMSFEMAKKAVDNMLAQGKESDKYSIFYFGGEPLLKKGLLSQISEYAYQEIAVKRKKKLKFLINTNATLVDKEVIALFKRYPFKVTVSIDGPEEIHDMNRIYSNGKGSYTKVIENIELLKKNAVPVQLRPTFSPKIKNLAAVFDFFEKLELPYGYAFSHSTDYKPNLGDTYFDKQQLKETHKELRSGMDYFADRIKKGETVFCREIIRKVDIVRCKARRTHLCEAGRKSLAVDETGKYFACQTMIPHRHAAMGDVDTNLDNTRRQQYMAKNITQISQCGECTIRNLCAGGCEVERMNSGSNVLNKQMCDLFRLEWENVLYLYAKIMEIK
jgi:uncharacterized protein